MRRAWMVVVAVVGAALLPSVANAQLSVGGHIGYGAGLSSTPDPYRGLFGVRSGWNFENFYLGGQVSFYTGEKISSSLDDITFRQLQVLGIDAGYDIDLKALYLRPIFGLGGAIGLRKVGGASRNDGAAFLNFGVEALSKLIKNKVFFGGGLRITSTFYSPDNVNAFSFYAVAGTRFDLTGDGKGIPTRRARSTGDEKPAKKPPEDPAPKKKRAPAPRPEEQSTDELVIPDT